MMGAFTYRTRKASGLCVTCGANRGPNGTTLRCRPCANKHAGINKKRRIYGCSRCGRQTKLNVCLKCKEAIVLSNKSRYARRDVAGVCVQCGDPRIGNIKLCLECWVKEISVRVFGHIRNWKLLLNKLEEQHNNCYYSGLPITPGVNASPDHIVPVSINPKLANDPGNIVWCDIQINYMKRDIEHTRFIALCKMISAHNV